MTELVDWTSLNFVFLFSEAYFRNTPKANEKEIEDKIALELKQAPFKKDGVKVKGYS